MVAETTSETQRTGIQEEHLVEVRDMKVYFPVTAGILFRRKVADVRAVDGISFHIKRGETLGLVGESGCGKSTTGRAILQLHRPTSGSVKFEGRELTKMGNRELRGVRKDMQIVFQDPYASLNPRWRINDIVSEPFNIHGF